MAVTVTLVRQGRTDAVYDVEATLDADVLAALPHTLAVAPERVTITPLLAAAYLSTPWVSALGAAQVDISMSAAVGSGAVGNQFRVVLELPHTIVR